MCSLYKGKEEEKKGISDLHDEEFVMTTLHDDSKPAAQDLRHHSGKAALCCITTAWANFTSHLCTEETGRTNPFLNAILQPISISSGGR